MAAPDQLHPFLVRAALSRTAAEVAAVVREGSEAPGIFRFGRLLHSPSVAALEGTPQAPALRALSLLCYGSWSDAAISGVSLSPAQVRKLRALTVAGLASGRSRVSYTLLERSIGLAGAALEAFLITECLASGVVRGRLDGVRRQLLVADAVDRDARPEEVDDVVAALEAWLGDARGALARLDGVAQRLEGGGELIDREGGLEERDVGGRRGAGGDDGNGGSGRGGGSEDDGGGGGGGRGGATASAAWASRSSGAREPFLWSDPSASDSGASAPGTSVAPREQGTGGRSGSGSDLFPAPGASSAAFSPRQIPLAPSSSASLPSLDISLSLEDSAAAPAARQAAGPPPPDAVYGLGATPPPSAPTPGRSADGGAPSSSGRRERAWESEGEAGEGAEGGLLDAFSRTSGRSAVSERLLQAPLSFAPTDTRSVASEAPYPSASTDTRSVASEAPYPSASTDTRSVASPALPSGIASPSPLQLSPYASTPPTRSPRPSAPLRRPRAPFRGASPASPPTTGDLSPSSPRTRSSSPASPLRGLRAESTSRTLLGNGEDEEEEEEGGGAGDGPSREGVGARGGDEGWPTGGGRFEPRGMGSGHRVDPSGVRSGRRFQQGGLRPTASEGGEVAFDGQMPGGFASDGALLSGRGPGDFAPDLSLEGPGPGGLIQGRLLREQRYGDDARLSLPRGQRPGGFTPEPALRGRETGGLTPESVLVPQETRSVASSSPPSPPSSVFSESPSLPTSHVPPVPLPSPPRLVPPASPPPPPFAFPSPGPSTASPAPAPPSPPRSPPPSSPDPGLALRRPPSRSPDATGALRLFPIGGGGRQDAAGGGVAGPDGAIAADASLLHIRGGSRNDASLGSARGATWLDASPGSARGATWLDASPGSARGATWLDASPNPSRSSGWADASPHPPRGALAATSPPPRSPPLSAFLSSSPVASSPPLPPPTAAAPRLRLARVPSLAPGPSSPRHSGREPLPRVASIEGFAEPARADAGGGAPDGDDAQTGKRARSGQP